MTRLKFIASYLKTIMVMWKLLCSEEQDLLFARSTIKRQKKQLHDVWEGEGYHDFGIERILRLFLALIAFTDIGLYLRNCFQGANRGMHRKLAVDGYVIFNLALPLVVLFTGWYTYPIVLIICIYFNVETLFALLSMSFLSPNIPSAISHRRNLLLLFLNYIQLSVCFAVMYLSIGAGSIFQGKNPISSPIQALYLSLETLTTVGFGDIVPINNVGYILLIVQMIISLFFVYIFFSVFASRFSDNTFLNRGKTNIKKTTK